MQIKLFGWRITLAKDKPIPFGMWKPEIRFGNDIDVVRQNFAAGVARFYGANGDERG